MNHQTQSAITLQASNEHPVTAVILCGGAGSRMDGADKPLLRWQQRPMIDHVLASVLCQTPHYLINANRNIQAYRERAPVFTDAPLESQSPLTGVLRALQEARTEWVWITPGDTPLLAADMLEHLRAAQQTSNTRLVTAHDGRRDQWLHMLLHRSLAESICNHLKSGQRSVHSWVEQLASGDHARADCSEIAASFLNVNEPGQLSAYV